MNKSACNIVARAKNKAAVCVGAYGGLFAQPVTLCGRATVERVNLLHTLRQQTFLASR
ncbi:MAG: hypothetical protein WCB68_02915 [Pyrinomonadaceae bacterium]